MARRKCGGSARVLSGLQRSILSIEDFPSNFPFPSTRRLPFLYKTGRKPFQSFNMPATNGVNVQTNGVNGHSGSALCTIDEFTSQAYDFVVVGGGTARLVVAARLTENPDVKVGVIEAGENVSTPSLYPTLIGREKYDWCMTSIPQPNAGNKTYSMPRGKLLPPQTVWLCKRRTLHCQQTRSDPATKCRTGSGHASYTCLVHYPRNVPQLPYDYIPLALPRQIQRNTTGLVSCVPSH
jgi:hypothetical protein